MVNSKSHHQKKYICNVNMPLNTLLLFFMQTNSKKDLSFFFRWKKRSKLIVEAKAFFFLNLRSKEISLFFIRFILLSQMYK